MDVATLNFSVRELVRMMQDGEMNISPEYQRKFRWTVENESTFIESVFLGLPVPPLFVATNDDFQWEVVDGLQRLSTLVHFLVEPGSAQELIHRDDALQLGGLEKLSDLNQRTFADLPKSLQLYFGRQPLQVVSLTDKSDLDVRFDLFERLNGGSIALSPQEVRACVFRGDFNLFIERLSENGDLRRLLKLQKSKQFDGTSAEQVLKFFAYKNARAAFDGKVTHYLNNFMGDAAEGNFDFAAEEESFKQAASRLASVCGGPYLRSDFGVTPLVQFEACLVGVAELISEGGEVVAPSSDWTDDPELKAASTGGTNSKAQLNRRIDRAKTLLRGPS